MSLVYYKEHVNFTDKINDGKMSRESTVDVEYITVFLISLCLRLDQFNIAIIVH